MKAYGNTVLVLALLQACHAFAENDQMTAADLIEMDFEDLVNMDVEIESAGKNSSRAMDLPYAATVISASEIQQSGAANIPDALRLAPGVVVGQISAGEWAIGIRGGEGRFSRYVLVMIDGRIVYNSVFSGVNWDELNLSLDDIERIEVIRGPNAASWGANAVNGIVHIITNKPDAARASRVKAWGGSSDRRGVSVSHSMEVDSDWALGVSALGQQWGGMKTLSEDIYEAPHKNWRLAMSLGRELASSATRFSADAFGVDQVTEWGWDDLSSLSNVTQDNQEDKSGWAIQLAHQQSVFEQGHWKLRLSADSTKRDTDLYQWDSSNYQLDLEVAGRWGNHSLAMGLNNRNNDSTAITPPNFVLALVPERRKLNYFGVYLSDRWDITRQLELTLAARLDDNEIGNSSLQPSARLLWAPNDSQRLWMAASKANTSASRALKDITSVAYTIESPELSGTPYPVVVVLGGNKGDSDEPSLSALEFGYRQTFEHFNVDIALFDFEYKNDVTVALKGDPVLRFSADYQPQYIEVNGSFSNSENYSSRGGELSMRGKWVANWESQLAVSRVRRLEDDVGWSSKVSFLNSISLAENWQWNIWLRYSDGDSGSGAQYSASRGLPDVHSYAVVDTNLSWSASNNVELTLIANNLGSDHTEARREEFVTELRVVEPYALLKVGYTF